MSPNMCTLSAILHQCNQYNLRPNNTDGKYIVASTVSFLPFHKNKPNILDIFYWWTNHYTSVIKCNRKLFDMLASCRNLSYGLYLCQISYDEFNILFSYCNLILINVSRSIKMQTHWMINVLNIPENICKKKTCNISVKSPAWTAFMGKLIRNRHLVGPK
jgi:hypothetical protein